MIVTMRFQNKDYSGRIVQNKTIEFATAKELDRKDLEKLLEMEQFINSMGYVRVHIGVEEEVRK